MNEWVCVVLWLVSVIFAITAGIFTTRFYSSRKNLRDRSAAFFGFISLYSLVSSLVLAAFVPPGWAPDTDPITILTWLFVACGAIVVGVAGRTAGGLVIIVLSLPWAGLCAKAMHTRAIRVYLQRPPDVPWDSGIGDLFAVVASSDPHLAREMFRDYNKPNAQLAREREFREQQEQRDAAFWRGVTFDIVVASACRLSLAFACGFLLILIEVGHRKGWFEGFRKERGVAR